VRAFALVFAFISLVMLAVFAIYVTRGPVDTLIASGIFLSFLLCLGPALLLLKPFEPPEKTKQELKRRSEARERRWQARQKERHEKRRGSD
jgi:hypothetical protein